MVNGKWKAGISLAVAVAQLMMLAPLSEGGSITAFSGGLATAEALLTEAAGGNATVAGLVVPLDSFLLATCMTVSVLPGARYPLSPSLDVGADGSPEWRFDGTGYGAFGDQTLLSDGASGWQADLPGPMNATDWVRLPKGATVRDARFGLEGSPEQRWWNASWHDRVPLVVTEHAGRDQTAFTVVTVLDARNWTVADARSEFRVTRVNGTTGEETEVPLQVPDEMDNGSKCFEATLVFAVSGLVANGTQTYHLYFNNPGCSRSPLYTDFNPSLIQDRLLMGAGEKYCFGPVLGPNGASFDRWGNYLVADAGRDCVWGYTGTLGVPDSPGSDGAHFRGPMDAVARPDGGIAVSDTSNYRVQVFRPDGTLNFTLGVSGVPGTDNAHFGMPVGLGTDAEGDIYVSDPGAQRIQIFDPNGSYLATIGEAGVPGSDTGHLRSPSGLCARPSGDFAVADTGNQRVLAFRRVSGALWAFNYSLGETGVPGGDSAHFFLPTDVTMDDAGNTYIADSMNLRVQAFSGQVYKGTIGVTGVGTPDNAHLVFPAGVAVSISGNIFVSDDGGRRVQVFDPGYRYVQTLGNRNYSDLAAPGNGAGAFDSPVGVTADAAGRIYVSDTNNQRVQVFGALGDLVRTLGVTGVPGTDNSHFYYPRGLDVAPDGKLLVADGGTYSFGAFTSNHRVLIFDDLDDTVADGMLGVTGVDGNDATHLNEPWDVSVNALSRVAVADRGVQVLGPPTVYKGERVQIYDDLLDYMADYTYGTAGQPGMDPTHLNSPGGVCLSDAGLTYVADTGNNRVVLFRNDGNNVADGALNAGGAPGPGTYELDRPADVAVDPGGNVYVADAGNDRVQAYDQFWGFRYTIGETAVNGSDALHLNGPSGIKVGGDGKIYIADTGNDRVVRITPAGLSTGLVEGLLVPEDVKVDVGAKGSADWSAPGPLFGKAAATGLASAFNDSLANISGSPDGYGNMMALVPVRLTCAGGGRLTLSNLSIAYDCALPVQDFTAAVAGYVLAHAGEADPSGNVTVPISFSAASAGGIRVGNLTLTADFPPDLTAPIPDRSLDQGTVAPALYYLADFFTDDYDATLSFSLVNVTNGTRAALGFVNGSILSVDCTGAAARLWNGVIDFRVKATDSRGQSTLSNPVNVTVRRVDHAPRITSAPPSLAARVGLEWTYDVLATDEDNDSLNYSLELGPGGMGIDAVSGQMMWKPASGQAGPANVSVRVSDGQLTDVQNFTINVSAAGTGRPPRFTSTPVSDARVGVKYSYQVRATDDDNATLAYALDRAPSGMTIDRAGGLIGWTPNGSQAGRNEVVVRVFGPNGSATQPFNITVLGPAGNLLPTIAIAEPAPNATVHGTIWLRGNASAAVGSVASVEVSLDGSGRWDNATGKTSWAYRLDTARLSNGRHQLHFRARDSSGNLGQAVLDINVDNPGPQREGALFGLEAWMWILFVVIIACAAGGAAFVATARRRRAAPNAPSRAMHPFAAPPQAPPQAMHHYAAPPQAPPQVMNAYQAAPPAMTLSMSAHPTPPQAPAPPQAIVDHSAQATAPPGPAASTSPAMVASPYSVAATSPTAAPYASAASATAYGTLPSPAAAPAPARRARRMKAVDSVFLIYHDGRLITYFSRSESMKLDDTLDMIRKFVRASFSGQLGNLDSMRYENMSILMERGNLMYMVVITPMDGHDWLRREMRCLLEEIDARYRVTFKIWDGDFNRVKGVKTMVESLAGEEAPEEPEDMYVAARASAAPDPAPAPEDPAPGNAAATETMARAPAASAPGKGPVPDTMAPTPAPAPATVAPGKGPMPATTAPGNAAATETMAPIPSPAPAAAEIPDAERLRLLEDRFLRGEITELSYRELREKLAKK